MLVFIHWKAIDLYFENNHEKPTLSGLAYELGFASRQSMYDYEKNKKHSYTIKRARLKIESHYEQRLNTQYSTGAIFALKNFGWRDTQGHRFVDDEDKDLPIKIIIEDAKSS